MGEIVLAAKCTSVPTMPMSKQEDPIRGMRRTVNDGQTEIAWRAGALGADTVVICDRHRVVKPGFHSNANARFKGLFSSKAFPQSIQDLARDHQRIPELRDAFALVVSDRGADTPADHLDSLAPMRFVSPEHDMTVVSIAAWSTLHDHSDHKVVVSGPLSHRMQPEYAAHCRGEGAMCEAAMLCALGRDGYDKPSDVVTPCFPSSGTAQTTVISPV